MLARRQSACGCFGENDVPASIAQSILSGVLAVGAAAAAFSGAHGLQWVLEPPCPRGGRDPARDRRRRLRDRARVHRSCRGHGPPGAFNELRPEARGVGRVAARPAHVPTERDLARCARGLGVCGRACALPLRPGTAWAVIGPGNCGSGLCLDGYTAFCCEIEHGRNTCPNGTYVAGWWKCTSYKGGGLCNAEGVRYYVDCNRIPGHVFPGGCQCARGDCHRRRIDCNHFRYGQCNTAGPGHDRGRLPPRDLPEPGNRRGHELQRH